MKNPENRSIRHYSLLKTLIIFGFAFVGCATGRQAIGPDLIPAQLPSYKEGTKYIYSNNTWEMVTAATPDMVSWVDHRGKVSSGSPNFIFRRAKWQTKKREGTREFQQRRGFFLGNATTLWPLRTGNSYSYTEIGSWSEKDGPENSYLAKWTCEVVGTETISVMAGDFDTWKILCRRYNSAYRLREIKTWYYAPAVGHYVLSTSKYKYRKRSKRLELIAVLPDQDSLSTKVRRKIKASFQHAMEFKKSGISVPWSDPSSDMSGKTTPTGTFQLENGTFCRRYVQSLNQPEIQRTYYGMACRDSRGEWLIPRT